MAAAVAAAASPAALLRLLRGSHSVGVPGPLAWALPPRHHESRPAGAEAAGRGPARSEGGELGRREVVLGTGAQSWALLAAGLLPPAAARGEAAKTRVALPQEGAPLYSFEIPAGRFVSETVDQADDGPPKIAKYSDVNGATILSGPLPEQDFIKKQREGSIGGRRKVLKYTLGEQEDYYECLVKLIQENGSIIINHRWFRVLRDPSGEMSKSALLILESPEDKISEEGPIMEAILKSFKLGA